jgi:cytochrome P450
VYKGQEDEMIQELFGFFLAGMKTIQIATTNVMYYLAKHKDVKEKMCAEVLP